MSKLFKALNIEIKANSSKREVEAYASTFGNKDLVGDIVVKGAFSKTISEKFASGAKNDIKVLWQHMPSMPIGLPIHMEEDSKGLYTVSKLSNTRAADEALSLVQDKVVDKMSIGYDVIKDEYSTEGARLLKELKLYEYSLVTFPANEQADILGSKSLEQLTTLLSQVGAADMGQLFSNTKAGAILSKANIDLLQKAIEALNEVLTVAGVEPGKATQPGSVKDIEEEINPQELQLILNSIKGMKI
jgi:HK97 family phage prohead protease